MAYTRKQLKKLYPEADENYLMVLLDGKIHSINYIKAKKKEVKDEFNTYYNEIYNVFVEYLDGKKRDYFLTDDIKGMKTVKKKINAILKQYYDWCLKHFVLSVSEFYNYKFLYDLWVFETIEEDLFAGEMSKGSKTFYSKKKLTSLVNHKQYGYSYLDRMENSMSLSADEVTSIIKGITTKDGATLENVKRLMNRRLKKYVANKMANATSLGLEDADAIAEEDIYGDLDTTLAFNGKWVRVEVLDKKTCFTCASVDGKVFKERLGSIHPHCRGIDVPYKFSDDKVTRLKDKLNRESKRQQRFDDWFNSLSEQDKKRVLGKKKYLSYVAGKTDVHNLMKKVRVDGKGKINMKELDKSALTDNVVLNATKVLKQEYSKLPKKRITNISTIDEYNAYKDYLSKKERMYRNLNMADLRKAGIQRKSLLEEISNEKHMLRQIKKTIE